MVDLVTLAAAAVCGAISCRIFTYQRHGAAYRFGVSLCAYILAAGTGMQALSISLAVLMARHATPISPYLLAVLVVLLVLVYRNKGNIALILRLS
ncbi:TPA: phage holin family protein [Pseudomonas aeruginosa]|nr:phage holin family protein [Pseudomonas aeruginosa]MBI8835241.1 phage holin family protein [Pseudomonas aeruginosa]HCF2109405.1 phage holin family protein [Pseudomonas aeruginosa]HEJ4516147.1 phage holin family protein [Pseudomonas aeruginosa]HEJ4530118.1 phage holin family protein [Pseudomonas aeruginosa]